MAAKNLRLQGSIQTLRPPVLTTQDDCIDDLYERNAFGDEDNLLESTTAKAGTKSERDAIESYDTKDASCSKFQGHKMQFDVWVARKDKYERMAKALNQLDPSRAAAEESWLEVAVALAATDCQLKTGKTSVCDCPGVCRKPAHSVVRQRTRCQCSARKCSLCRRCIGTKPGELTPKMIAVLEPYEGIVSEALNSTPTILALAEKLARTGEGQSLSLKDGTSIRITTAAYRMAQTVLAQCSVLESTEGVKLQHPCTCPVRSLGDLWLKWSSKNHTFSRVPLTEFEANSFSAGTRQMMDQEKNEDGIMTYYMTLKWHAAVKPQKGDTAKIAARRALTTDQKRQNALFLRLCKKYWQKAQLRVAEYLQKTLAATGDAQNSGKSVSDVEMAALNRLGVRRMLQWIQEDAEAVENARQEEAREKVEGGLVAHNAWVRRKDRLRIRMPIAEVNEDGRSSRHVPPPRFDFSMGAGVVRHTKPCRPPGSTAELMQNSGLKYVHAMSEGFQGRGGDLEKSKQVLVQQGHVLRENFDQGIEENDEDSAKPTSEDRYLFERRNNPVLRKKAEADRRRREQSRENYAAWVAHKAMRDKAVNYMKHLPSPREGAEDDPVSDHNTNCEGDFDKKLDLGASATPAAVRWEAVGKALKAVDRTLLDTWVRWSRGYRSAGRCRAFWDSFTPISCDVHCTSSPLRNVFLKLLHCRPSGIKYRQACVDLCLKRHKKALARGDAVDKDGDELDEDLDDSKLIQQYGSVTGRELTALVRSVGVILQPEETQRVVEFFADPEEVQASSGAIRISLESFLAVVGDERHASCRGNTDQLLRSVCMWETVCHECGMLNAFQLVLGTEGSNHRRRAELPGHVCRRENYGGRFNCSPESDMVVVQRVAPRRCAFAEWDDTQAAPYLKKLELWSAAPREQHVLRELVTSGQPPSIPVLERDDDDDTLDMTTMLRLRWRMPESGDGGPPAFYQLESAGAEGSTTFRLNKYHEICRDPKDYSDNDGLPRCNFTLIGLMPNTKYAIRVRALNGFGAGAYAFSYFVTAPARPAEPLPIAIAPHSVKLAWETSSYYARRLRELEVVFREADADGNGRISRDEFMEEIERRKPKLVAFLQQATAGATATDNNAARLSVFDAIETDDNESISWDEFLRFFHEVLDLSDTASQSSQISTSSSRSSTRHRGLLSGSKSSHAIKKTTKSSSRAASKCRYILKQCLNESTQEYIEIYRGTTPRFEVLGLHSGSTYQFRVQAINAEGRASLHSEPVIVNTLLPTPASPTVNTASSEPAVQSECLQLRWSVAKALPSLSSAALRVSDGTDGEISRLLKEWAQETSLDDGAVDFKVRFDRYDVDGSGYLELPEFQTLLSELGVPPTPERLAAYLAAFDLDSDGKISFSEFARWWTQSEVHYVLKRDAGCRDQEVQATGTTNADEMRLVCYRGSESITTVNGLEPNTRYRFRLRVVGAHASSALSEALTICTAPSVPTCVGRVEVGFDKALVCWHPGPGGATRYIVDCKRIECLTKQAVTFNENASEWRRAYEGREPLAYIRELQPETVYQVRVFALNSSGISSAQSTISQLCTVSKECAQRRARLVKRPSGAADYFTIECGPEEGDIVLGDTVLFCERLMRRNNDADRSLKSNLNLAQASDYSVCSSTGGAEVVGERNIAAKVVGISQDRRQGNVLALCVLWCTVQIYDVESSKVASSRGGYRKQNVSFTRSSEASVDSFSLAPDLKISRRERNLYRFDTFRAKWEDEAARYPGSWDK
ncbi:protein tyrosine receptor type [Plasmopara halstedii]|uniref:Protein tyrosine receptor type n=1 Tax=Plasmopara halstedii TaxID=4781 RepID=A0A0P1A4C5_PLAHL|nr:protein tyrosine receptor type [Plasmopara halstedii]CEG35159.1 protein tyrosine receptor type [Plasmopara halstedii]|eukprot:XP_024571528.1 protein tyrosine receptor type [Plasmopara halstedii]